MLLTSYTFSVILILNLLQTRLLQYSTDTQRGPNTTIPLGNDTAYSTDTQRGPNTTIPPKWSLRGTIQHTAQIPKGVLTLRFRQSGL
ncbi:hypothetical protein BGX38DRAFT_1176673 [Terfezia claveryi]|nr:hypothetical protein BGX38DRAFT_1176673 [Terfezia claveryi]